MFDKEIFNECLTLYKKNFSLNLLHEKYNEWEIVKCFQDNWDIDAENFADMLAKSLKKLKGKGIFIFQGTLENIKTLAKEYPETVREMFKKLYDEDVDVSKRFEEFQNQSKSLFEKIKKSKSKIQTNSAISTYLLVRYPDKYYIYKKVILSSAAKKLNSTFPLDIPNFYKFCDEICAELQKDAKLVKMLKSKLTADCYADPNLKILTTDFIFYVGKILSKAPAQTDNNVTANYTKKNFLDEVYMSAEKYDLLVAVLNRKKNIILQGAPGVGKTFAAKRLAYSLIGEETSAQIKLVQFHQNYSYEDFVMGYRPNGETFELKRGIFYEFCKDAEKAPNKNFYFIIDEINRGNLSKIFGELLMLIESDHRAEKIKLAYDSNGDEFSVPENLYIIGMMNTADRSLAMIDYALRRRFSFIEIEPAFDSDGFKKYQHQLNNPTFDKLIDAIKRLNQDISKSLGKGFCIGHSYFCGLENNCTKEILRAIVDYEILPMLAEYFFDDESKFNDCENLLRGVFNA